MTDLRIRPRFGCSTELQEAGVSVIHQVNQGQAAAAMTGLHATSASYVMRFDSDDTLVPGAVAALADALDDAREAAAAWGDVQTFGLTNVRIPKRAGPRSLARHVHELPSGRRDPLSANGALRKRRLAVADRI